MTNSISRFIHNWLPALLWMFLIFFLSSRHSVGVAPDYWLNFLFFKMLHVIEYAVLYLLLFRGFYSLKKLSLKQKLIYAAICAVLYGATDEIHQMFVPSRGPALRDVLIDSLGIFLAFQYTKRTSVVMKTYETKPAERVTRGRGPR